VFLKPAASALETRCAQLGPGATMVQRSFAFNAPELKQAGTSGHSKRPQIRGRPAVLRPKPSCKLVLSGRVAPAVDWESSGTFRWGDERGVQCRRKAHRDGVKGQDGTGVERRRRHSAELLAPGRERFRHRGAFDAGGRDQRGIVIRCAACARIPPPCLFARFPRAATAC
jgi:hypothetical protein